MNLKEEYERRKAERNRRTEEAMSRKGFGKTWIRHPDPIVRLTSWIALFTGFLVVVGGFQGWAFVQSERGFMHLEDIQLRPLSIGTPVSAVATLENSGRSITEIMGYNISWKFLDNSLDLPDIPQYYTGNGTPITGSFVPDEEIKTIWTSRDSQNFATDKLISDIKLGKVRVFVYGYMTYKDSFSLLFGRRVTRFCAVYDATINVVASHFGRCGKRDYEYSD